MYNIPFAVRYGRCNLVALLQTNTVCRLKRGSGFISTQNRLFWVCDSHMTEPCSLWFLLI